MDLALQLGGTVSELRERMPERELNQWAMYAKQRVMPLQRIELYLAQVAWIVARAVGGSESAILSDFIIDFGNESEPEREPSFDDAAAAFGFNPRPKVKDGSR